MGKGSGLLRNFTTVAFAAVTVATALLGAVAQPSRAATLDSFENDLVAQVNQFRASRGLPTVVVSDTLTAAAKWMSTDMAVENYFAHTSLDGRSPTQRMADAGYPAYTTWTGEDLAAGYTSARDVLNGWINSPAHYAVLTDPAYRAIGVGRSYSASSAYRWYWAADFGGVVDSGAAVAASFDPGFHDAWAGQSPDPVLAPGQVTTLVVALKNAGYRGWYLGRRLAGGTARGLRGTAAWGDSLRASACFGTYSVRGRHRTGAERDRIGA